MQYYMFQFRFTNCYFNHRQKNDARGIFDILLLFSVNFYNQLISVKRAHPVNRTKLGQQSS